MTAIFEETILESKYRHACLNFCTEDGINWEEARKALDLTEKEVELFRARENEHDRVREMSEIKSLAPF